MKQAIFKIKNVKEYTLTKKQTEGLKVLSDKSKKFIKFWGGARSGKTFLICLYILRRALRYKESVHLIARYSKQSAKNTVWRQEMLPILRNAELAGWCKINYSECYATFVNGSIVQLGGLMPSDITSVLSSEFQTIFVCEANENSFEIIETLQTRLNGNRYSKDQNNIDLKFIIDLNPTLYTSWTYQCFIQGINPITEKPIENYNQYANLHFKPIDNLENISADYIKQLDSMSEAKRQRFLFGEYGSFEGVIYTQFGQHNIIDDFELDNSLERGLSIDFGFIHPFVAIAGAYDESTETLYIYKEYVQTKQTVRYHCEYLKNYFTPHNVHINTHFEFIVCDHDAEDRATMIENDIQNEPANKSVLNGIERCQELFERGKIKIFRSCTNVIKCLESYRWKQTTGIESKDRTVLKIDDDEADSLRYLVMKFYPIEEEMQVSIAGGYFGR